MWLWKGGDAEGNRAKVCEVVDRLDREKDASIPKVIANGVG